MAEQGLAPASGPAPPIETKASLVRGVMAVAAAEGLLTEIEARLTPATRAFVADLPPASTWIDSRILQELLEVELDICGPARLRQIHRKAIDTTLKPILWGAVERTLRLFGTSPATLLQRMDILAGTTARGVGYRYTATSETSGTFDIEHQGQHDVPMAVFIASAAGIESVLDICGVDGTVSEPQLLRNGLRNTGRYTVEWRSRS